MNWKGKIITGLGIGSFVFMVTLLFKGATEVTAKTVLAVFSISAFVGVTTCVFDVDRIKSFFAALFLHYCMVLLFVTVLDRIVYGNTNLIDRAAAITVIYVISYIVTVIKTKITANQMNRYLMQMNEHSK